MCFLALPAWERGTGRVSTCVKTSGARTVNLPTQSPRTIVPQHHSTPPALYTSPVHQPYSPYQAQSHFTDDKSKIFFDEKSKNWGAVNELRQNCVHSYVLDKVRGMVDVASDNI